MHRETVEVYEERGREWATRRAAAVRADDARAFAAVVPLGEPRLDVGCGAGRYLDALGRPVVGLDASWTMVALAREAAPDALLVQGDVEAMPFRDRSLSGAWANMSYLHVPRPRLPLALARLHWVLRPGAPFDLQVHRGDFDFSTLPDDHVPGRWFAGWEPEPLADVVAGAGFEVHESAPGPEGDVVRVRAVRLRSLPDTVGPDMRLLVCGLNPSVYAADRGIGFARPTNRFWGAAVAAGIVSRPFDPLHALVAHGVGMTDLVKRATVGSRELSAQEYRAGAGRVERLVRWLRPRAVCFVGLEGWRAAVDRRAAPGWQPEGFGGVPAYVMPSTSGLNAHASRDALAAHLAAAIHPPG
ncbi:MAG TPA: methyltransferase domain-containing protein [Acidimicrobiales bacterium]|nr:methyltransferase domain-containing protein [Acidimicrobiales bacterium]